MACLNCFIIAIDVKSRCNMICHKLSLLIDDIQHVMDEDCRGWIKIDNYPFIRIPFANSVNLQWCIRDNQLINLPVVLLVKGDYICLRPGQQIFSECTLVKTSNLNMSGYGSFAETYKVGQVFLPTNDHKSNLNHHSYSIVPMHQCSFATVTKSPCIEYLDRYFSKLTNLSASWHSSSVPQRYIEFSINCQLIFIISLQIIHLILSFSTTSYYKQLPKDLSSIILLGLPIQMPVLLILTTANATYTLSMLRYKLERRNHLLSPVQSSSLPSEHSIPSSSSSTPQSLGYNELDVQDTNPFTNLTKSTVLYHLSIFTTTPPRNHQFSQLMFTLANLTSLCCVDKKGVLADPIAVPEKIFFNRKKHHRYRPRSNSLINLEMKLTQHRDSNTDTSNINNNQNTVTNTTSPSSNTITKINSELLNIGRFRSITTDITHHNQLSISSSHYSTHLIHPNPLGLDIINNNPHPLITKPTLPNNPTLSLTTCNQSVPIILDISRDSTNPYLPSFDDNKWHRYMSSLKPIGLNILLNNCNPQAADRYTNFADNICAMNCKTLNKSLLTQRCICALSTQIGFKNMATDHFSLETTFAICRNKKNELRELISPNEVYSPPLGNVFVTVIKDTMTNTNQLMSQGSADLLLSLCDHYWDGRDVIGLSDIDRTRILDFYKRNIFSSYCLALAYSPVLPETEIPRTNKDEQFILQFNERDVKSLSTHMVSNDHNNIRRGSSYTGLVSDTKKGSISHTHLGGGVVSGSAGVGGSGPGNMSILGHSIKSTEIAHFLRPQIFLGMISLQADQVESDVIDSINKLEQACIRFVYFSLDNQLRSRVFAERLGLESGWNCHISLADPLANDIHSSSKSSQHRNSDKFNDDCIIQEENNTSSNTNKSEHVKQISKSEPLLTYRRRSSDIMTHSTTVMMNGRDFSQINTEVAGYGDIPLINEMTSTSGGGGGGGGSVRDHQIYNHIQCSNSTLSDDDDDDDDSSNTQNHNNDFVNDPQDHYPDNKSKLPCGIKSIRPHLENIDNIPLQVSLFTDCNAEVNLEMMTIMREYGEIVCCCGSSLSLRNLQLFAANDCSIAFVPGFHRVCWKDHNQSAGQTQFNYKSPLNPTIGQCCATETDQAPISLSSRPNKEQQSILEQQPMLQQQMTLMDPNVCLAELNPINVASRIVSLPCGLLLNRKITGFSIVAFITESHRLVNNILAMLGFYCLACACLSLLKFLGNLVVLSTNSWFMSIPSNTSIPTPTSLPTDIILWKMHIIYHMYYHLPILALLIYSRSDIIGKPLKQPSRKRLKVLTIKQCFRFIMVSCGRFLPSLLFCLINFTWNISTIYSTQFSLNIIQKIPSYYNITNSSSNIYTSKLQMTDVNRVGESVISDFIFVQFNVYMIIVSFFYISIEKYFWKFSPKKNIFWSVICIILILLQIIYIFIKVIIHEHVYIYLLLFHSLYPSIILSICGCVVIFSIGVLSNIWEKRALSNEYRLWRLYFGTKLGMYSPV